MRLKGNASSKVVAVLDFIFQSEAVTVFYYASLILIFIDLTKHVV